jgi:hypothetical protein
MEMFGVVLGLSVVTWILIALAAGLLFPLFWLWMLIDAVVREQASFPSQETAEKVMWIVLMLVVQPVATIYFFLVWRPGRRGETAQPPIASPLVPAAPAAA